jgi:hypothetical protein
MSQRRHEWIYPLSAEKYIFQGSKPKLTSKDTLTSDYQKNTRNALFRAIFILGFLYWAHMIEKPNMSLISDNAVTCLIVEKEGAVIDNLRLFSLQRR